MVRKIKRFLSRRFSATTLLIASFIFFVCGSIILLYALLQFYFPFDSQNSQVRLDETGQEIERTVAQNPQGLILAASAIFLAAGVLLSNAISILDVTRNRAFEMIKESKDQEDFFPAMRLVRDRFFEKQLTSGQMKKQAYIIYFSHYKEDQEVKKALFRISNFFEQIWISIDYNEMKEEIIEDFYAGMFVRFYSVAKHFYPVMRNINPEDGCPYEGHPHGKTQMPEMFIGCDYLFARWKPDYDGMYAALTERHRTNVALNRAETAR